MLNDVIVYFIELGRDAEYEDIYTYGFPDDTMEMTKEAAETHLKRIESYVIDYYDHNLRPLDEYIIYHIITYVDEVVTEPEFFFENYEVKINSSDQLDIDEKYFLSRIIRPIDLIDLFFEDVDFLDLDRFIKMYKTQPELVTNFFAINLDEYEELIPRNIFEEYKSLKSERELSVKQDNPWEIENVQSFYVMIEKFFEKLKFLIAHNSGNRVIKNKNGTLDEKGVQSLILITAKMFFHQYPIDISSESDTGRGTVDFKFSYGSHYKLLTEVKLSSHTGVEKGFKFQLPTYLHAEECTRGILVLVCLEEEDYRKEESYLDSYDKTLFTIKFFKIDASGSLLSASRIRNEDEMGINH